METKHTLVNPMDSLDRPWKKGKRKVVIPLAAHLKLVGTARGINKESGRPFPAWVAVYFEAGWETGWRAPRITIVDEAYEYKHAVECAAPFPCSPYYDAKAWNWLTRAGCASRLQDEFGPVVFWNIGA